MKLSQNLDAFLTMALVSAISSCGAMGCGARGGEPLSDGERAAICEPGDTRGCVGPGACRGGQICDSDARWEVCACGSGAAAGFGTKTRGNGAAGKGFGGASTSATTPNIAGNFSYFAPGGTTGTSRGGTSAGGTNANRGGASAGGTNANRGGASAGGTNANRGGANAGGASAGGATGTNRGGTSATGANSGAAATGMAGAAYGGMATTIQGGQGFGGTTSTGVGGISSGAGGTSLGGSSGADTGGSTNQPPVIVGLAFSSSTITVRSSLTVYPNATDPEGDAVTFSYAWTRNGQPVGSDENHVYGDWHFVKGDAIRVTVTPHDRTSSGASVTSETIVVQNARPQIDGMATVDPGWYADDATDLECVASAWDNDGDPITFKYLWYLNDVATTNTSSTLPASATSSGDSWACEVTASDGSDVAISRSGDTQVYTQVSGIYRSDVTWQAQKSPYFLSSRVQIAPGVTLTIEPGVELFGNEQFLESWGNISAIGTKDKPIFIRSLHLVDNSSQALPGKVGFAFVEYSDGDFFASSANAGLTISDCVFRYIWNVVSLNAVAPAAQRFERNAFYACCGIQSASPLTLINNVFSQSETHCTDVVALDLLTATHNSFLDLDTEQEVALGTKSGDLRANYWGGIVDVDVPGRILDNIDNLSIQGVADYLPTLPSAHVDTPAPDKTYQTLR